MRAHALVTVVVSLCVLHGAADGAVAVFWRGEGSYYCIKIPGLLLTSSGTLLAFGEARKPNCDDTHIQTDIVIKRSFDKGKSW